jgi:hypothetical protein
VHIGERKKLNCNYVSKGGIIMKWIQSIILTLFWFLFGYSLSGGNVYSGLLSVVSFAFGIWLFFGKVTQ